MDSNYADRLNKRLKNQAYDTIFFSKKWKDSPLTPAFDVEVKNLHKRLVSAWGQLHPEDKRFLKNP
jgi:hypothetical protein